MSRRFEPSLSYREKTAGGGVRGIPLETLSRILTRHSSVVLLLHGYNNDLEDASAAYTRFQGLLGEVRANVVGVFWPGDNWEGPLYYMRAIGQAQKVAPLLAGDLHTAAWARGHYRIDIVAHSLGSRLALETIRELLDRLRTYPVPGLTIGRIVFMAGAVPTHYLEVGPGSPRSLRGAIGALEAAMSLYSEDDRVLHYAFPLGQSAAREGFLPVALGRRGWPGGALLTPALRQERNQGAGHSDYWGGGSKNEQALGQAARYVRGFIDLGVPQVRELEPRGLAERPSSPGREITGRKVTSRGV